MTALRNLTALIVGVAASMVVNMSIIIAGSAVIPPPPGIDVSNPDSLAANIHRFTPAHFAVPFLAHAVGTLAGAFVAHVVAASRRWTFAWVVGLVGLAGGIAASRMIPAPMWFVALDLLAAYLPMAWIGGTLASKARPESSAGA